MDIVFGVADRIVVLNFGKILATGTPKDDRRESRGAGRLPG